MRYKLLHGDCLIKMKEMDDNSVDAIATDPPYGFSFMGKKWDYDVPSVAIWHEAFRVLKPGGHMIAFSGSRTYHRMVVNIEDAGFEIRDQIMWVYGSGFPKSLNISKAIDKAAGAEREVVGYGQKGRNLTRNGIKGDMLIDSWHQEAIAPEITAPATPEAKQWDGWGSALKPAHEPIVLARKPLIGTIVENVLEHGTGGLNIDGCRVLSGGEHENWNPSFFSNRNGSELSVSHIAGSKNRDAAENDRIMRNAQLDSIKKLNEIGRFPANFIHDGSDEVVSLFPQSNGGHAPKKSKANPFGGVNDTEREEIHYGTGSAARFFYCAKVSKTERGEGNVHPTVKPIDLMRYLCRLITPPNGTVLDPFMGSGTTGIAATQEDFNFIGIEMDEEYLKIANHRISTWVEEKQELIIEQRKQRTLFDGW